MKNVGNPAGIINVMKRASAGEAVTIGFIGGSITQGAVVSDEALCYAARVFAWWKYTFPQSDVKYVNAGIGATTSQFGVARADDDLLKYDPDFVIVEYSVNDNDEKPYEREEFFRETYEGLIRKLLTYKNSKGYCPALLIVHSVRYDDGGNMEEVHSEIGSYYGIPCISMKELIYEKVKRREVDYSFDDITNDMLHPNDMGHGIVAGHITDYLESIMEQMSGSLSEETNSFTGSLPEPISANRYQNMRRYNAFNLNPVLNGFTADESPVMKPLLIDTGILFRVNEYINGSLPSNGSISEGMPDCVLSSESRDVFKRGWRASKKGDSITFEFSGSELAVMYRKSVKKPAPVAYAMIDGDDEHRIKLDANFNEDWGDKAYMTTLVHHGFMEGNVELERREKHSLTITIDRSDECVVDFCLINVLRCS